MSKFLVGAVVAIAAVVMPVMAQMPERAMATSMTRADVEARVKERFAKIDVDRNGSVTKSEIEGSRAAKMKERQDRHFAEMDANADGTLSLSETMAKAMARFDAADVNKDGVMTPEERKASRQKMRDEWRAKRG